VTAHCANTGSLLGLAQPGSAVLLSDAGRSASRRLRYTWEAVRSGRGWVAVNTTRANQVAALALRMGLITGLAGYTDVRAEVPVSSRSRIDFALRATGRPTAYVEVKSVTLREDRAALFPDAVTERGRRHLDELERLARGGHRAVLLLLVMRPDCDRFAPADAIDPAYGRTLRRVARRGVEIQAHAVRVSARGLRLETRLPVRLA
jgi:sugar fermentation stimulation protein A